MDKASASTPRRAITVTITGSVPCRSRVDDMGIAPPADIQVLFGIARGGNRARWRVADVRRPAWPIFQPRCPGGGSPNARSPLAATSALWMPRPEAGERGIGRITLGDAAEIELHAGLIQHHGAAARNRDAACDIRSGWRPRASAAASGSRCSRARLPPKPDHRTERDIERAIGLFGELAGCGQHAKEIGAGCAPVCHGCAADAVQFAVGLVVGKRGVQFGDARERCAEGGLRLRPPRRRTV